MEARGYIICAEPRSGSNLLSRLLDSTGQLGKPRELFSPRRTARRILWRDPAGGLARVIAHASTPNGVYGFKVFTFHFDIMASTHWVSRLPGLRFVQLERGDLLGQAISYVRARQTRAFSAWRLPKGEARYNAKEIASALARLAQNDSRWRAYFARNGIVPLRLRYEDLIADPRGAVAGVAELVRLEEAAEADLGLLGVGVQRDALNEEWRERFLAEAGDLDRLDGWPLAQMRARVREVRTRLGV